MTDRPWIFRTYSGHSTAEASNRLYRTNLAKGQTGLSVAFDLPTQTGYDADHVLALGEVGKVGVPIGSIEDMQALFEGIPLDQMNTSMTINATAAWLLALYIALGDRLGVSRQELSGTTQNDIIKEYLSRGTFIFPPQPSMRLTKEMIEYTVDEVPRWNPINICSYHLQEVGATPVQEIAFALANAMAVLDAVEVPAERMPVVFGRISFFCNAGIRFIEEICKMRAFTRMWDRIGRERYHVEDPALRRFRFGVQVNSLGLTQNQPENNIPRIVLEALGVTLSHDARCRALQLPAWNEALGLPRPWDQQWSLRIQQILAHETDVLEYEDIFEGSHVIERRVREIETAAWAEIGRIEELGGAVAAVESGYLKRQLVESNAQRVAAIESGERVVVGVNRFQEGEPSPLVQGASGGILSVDESAGREQIQRLQAHRRRRNSADVGAALAGLRDAVQAGHNVMPPSIRCAEAGVTTGEWADTLRAIFGEYRAPTGVDAPLRLRSDVEAFAAVRRRVDQISQRLGRRLKLLMGKPGLDGHSSGAEQIAIFAREAGFEVVYQGIRMTPDEILSSAQQEGVHLIGLSILSGSHLTLVPEIARRADVPVVVGGIIPEDDASKLRADGVAAVYTPADYDVARVIAEMVEIAAKRTALPEPGLDRLVERVLEADPAAIAGALDRVEDSRPEMLELQRALVGQLEAKTPGAHTVVGLTGPPGAGKSSLAGALIRSWLEAGSGVGMVAIDPTSRRSGGALLGDRARLRFSSHERVFVRSMAARDQLGGLAPATRAAVVVLRAAFGWTLVETVGVGQSEVDVATVADSVVLVLQPGSGDTLQFMKAGILEIPDVLVVHKSDLGAVAQRTRTDLEAMLAISPDTGSGWRARVLSASAQEGSGIAELASCLAEHRAFLERSGQLAARRAASRVAWARELFERRFGSYGVERVGGVDALRGICAGASGSALDAFSDLAKRAGFST